MKKVPIALLTATAIAGVQADCECGYSTSVSNSGDKVIFTDLLETDFTRHDRTNADANWKLPQFNLTKQETHGNYGLNFHPSNTLSYEDNTPISEESLSLIPDVGAELFVSGNLEQDMVSVAEMDSRRSDLTYGSYRASMKLTDVPGTCASLMWYFNETQEIDMEFLSKDFDRENNVYPVNLVVQTSQPKGADYDPTKDSNYIQTQLPFDPTSGFHEYRIDYLPGEVIFYADGVPLERISGAAVPTTSGHFILQHWSDGNSVWSGGPPEEDTSVTVRYVKAYFNSSDTALNEDRKKECSSASAKNVICEIPDVGKDKSAENMFFSKRNITKTAKPDKSDKKKGKGAAEDVKSGKPTTTTKGDGEKKGDGSVWSVQAGVVVAAAMLAGVAVFAL